MNFVPPPVFLSGPDPYLQNREVHRFPPSYAWFPVLLSEIQESEPSDGLIAAHYSRPARYKADPPAARYNSQ